jgi:HNH endonuclease
MAACMRCNTTLNFFENLSHLGRPKVCFACERQISDTLQRLEHQIQQLSGQSGVTEQFRAYVLQELANNHIPVDRTYDLLKELDYLKHLTDIRQGRLPIIQVNAILDIDELAHLDTTAIYYKPNKQVRFIHGRVIATNKKLYFITLDRDSMKIDWNNVVNVYERPGQMPDGKETMLMQIEVSKGVGGGLYLVADPTLTVAIITTAVRMWKRHLVELKGNPNTQGIPEHVKVAVFQRDEGRCRQCGYAGPYVEYDHIIPRSKGGQNTVENIQLLCRQCNLKKSNRI